MLIRDISVIRSLVRKVSVRDQLSSSRHSSFTRLQSRVPANDVSMDTNLLATNPDLVISHLTSRRSNPALLEDVSKIAGLRAERNQFIVKSDTAKGVRKNLSQKIGTLMKEGKADEVTELKRQVEEATVKAAECDAELVTIDAKINELFSVLPNLLDDRY
jgi:seryl-tRNA synthetase